LVPEVVEDFFLQSSPFVGLSPKETFKGSHKFRIGKTPSRLLRIGEKLEPRFGKLGKEYKQITFDKK
jgi:hypothetical protein